MEDETSCIRAKWSPRAVLFMTLSALISFGVFLGGSDEQDPGWLVLAGISGFLAVQYGRACICTNSRGVRYRGILRWWHVDWNRVVRFEKTEWHSEGGVTEYPVIVLSGNGDGNHRRRRMFAIGSRKAKEGERSEIDGYVDQLNELATWHRGNAS